MTDLNGSGQPGFDRAAYDRFKLPRRLGAAIAAWDGPDFVRASDARHMRPDDYVLGIVVNRRPRAYPLWIIDNYHVVNDAVDGRRFIVTSCERCGSGSAFFAEPPGTPSREPLFRAGGLLNAVLMMTDMRSGSHWIHYEGVGLDRRAAGFRLPWIPTYHIEWAAWQVLHPDTEVWSPPEDPRHPDARHGHGREEFFARPGMEPALLETMVVPYDTTYPENEMVLGVGDHDRSVAFPWREVQLEGGVTHDLTAEGRIVVFAGPSDDGITMAAFLPVVDDEALTFTRGEGAFIDTASGSRWTIEGVAVDGPRAGASLTPIRSFYVRWHAWVNWHRSTRLFRSGNEPSRYGDDGARSASSAVHHILTELARRGRDVRFDGPLASQQRPRRSTYSARLRIDGDPVIVHDFVHDAAARDHEAMRGARSALPLRPRVSETKLRRLGSVVIESVPGQRFLDPAHVVPVPWTQTRWAAVLDAPELEELSAASDTTSSCGFTEVIRALRGAGYEVIETASLPPGQLRVGVLDAMALTVDGDRMLLYLFEHESGAEEYGASEPHIMSFGRFALRSTPDTMYVHQFYEILYAGDDRIAWSSLLSDRRFQAILAEGVTARNDEEVVQAGSHLADVL